MGGLRVTKKNEVELNNAMVISNLLELVSKTVATIAGNDIANSINNNKLTKDVLQTLIMQRVNTTLASKQTEGSIA